MGPGLHRAGLSSLFSHNHGRALPAVLLIIFVIAGAGCGKKGDGKAGPAAAAHGGHGPGGQGGPGGPPAEPPVPVAVEAAFTGSISSYYTATATLEADNEAEVLARVSGTVLSLGVEEGDYVRKGATLLSIQDEEYRLRVAQAQARTANLTARFERLKKMWEGKLVSAEEFEAARNDLESAKAEEGLAELNLSYTRVEAPFSGRVTRRLVNIGQNVSSGTPLFVVSDFDPLLARVHVPAKEFRRLKPDQPVELVMDSNKERLRGRIKLVSPIIDPQSGTIKVTVEIPAAPDNVRPGDFAQVSIVTEDRHATTLVPKIAVFTDKGDQIVYVCAADSTAERRVVEVGFQDDRNAEILAGLKDGERTVVKGQRSLKHGSKLKILDAATDSSAPAADSLNVALPSEARGS